MHESRHFLSYRKRRHDAENHVHTYAHYVTLWSRCKMASSHRVTDLGEKSHFESARMKLRRRCQQLGLCLFRPCYFIFLEPCYSSFHNRLDLIREPAFFIGCFILFSQFILDCFIKCKIEKVLFVLVQQTSDFVASLGQGLGLGQLPVLAIHTFFSLLACAFVSRVISSFYDVRVRGGSLDV